MDATARAVEAAARAAYLRLVAWLGARSRDIAGAEDALSDAFAAALTHWRHTGIPADPQAWLLTTARRRMIDAARRHHTREAAIPTLLLTAPTEFVDHEFPDERLKLLFVCAHPAIDPAARTPLMLQVVLGLDAATIARAFVASPTAISQRLVRAKEKIRTAHIPFLVPEASELPPRLDAVLQAIYACYATGWDRLEAPLEAEALHLARIAFALLPTEPEAMGLLALLLFCASRRDARRNAAGAFIPLDRQDPALWSAAMIDEAHTLLTRAAAAGRPGRFQLEAAIQSVHIARRDHGHTDWSAIALLYEGLWAIAPTIGIAVARAAALAEAIGPADGLAALPDAPTYQPYWVTRASLLRRLGRTEDADAATAQAIALTEDPALRAFLGEEGRE